MKLISVVIKPANPSLFSDQFVFESTVKSEENS